MISGFSTQTAGNRQMVITYGGEQVVVVYKVYKLELTSNVWYVSNDYDNNGYGKKLFVQFKLDDNAFGAWAMTPEEQATFNPANLRWITMERNRIDNTYEFTKEMEEMGYSYDMKIYNISNETFTFKQIATNLQTSETRTEIYTFERVN